jgi:hypothetical protein
VCQQLINVGLAQDLDVSICLFNIDSVKRIEDAFITQINVIFAADCANKITNGFSAGKE